MSVLNDALRQHLDELVASDRVVLFMKGNRSAPQCGFSARVVDVLDGYLDSYGTVDVLGNMNVREGMKEYAQWPTFPQLWVDGELIGGCDILMEMEEQGQLSELLGGTTQSPPSITLTDAATQRILGVIPEGPPRLRLKIDARFRYQFEMVDELKANDLVVSLDGLELVLDRVSARRADGMVMDYVDSNRGTGLVVDNPNEPATVQQLSVEQYAQWRAEDRPHKLYDVRTDQEWSIARIEGAILLDPDAQAALEALPKDTTLVFQCHHGVRSQHAAQHFLGKGFKNVYNLAGGIDAWSIRVDDSVPRY